MGDCNGTIVWWYWFVGYGVYCILGAETLQWFFQKVVDKLDYSMLWLAHSPYKREVSGSIPSRNTTRIYNMKHTPDTIKESLRRCKILRENYWDILPEELKTYIRIVEKNGKASKRQASRAKRSGLDWVIRSKKPEYEATVRAITACAARNNSTHYYIYGHDWE